LVNFPSKFSNQADDELTKEFQNHLPAHAVITGPVEIVDLSWISEPVGLILGIGLQRRSDGMAESRG